MVVAAILGLFFLLVVLRVAIDIMQPKGHFFDALLGRPTRAVKHDPKQQGDAPPRNPHSQTSYNRMVNRVIDTYHVPVHTADTAFYVDNASTGFVDNATWTTTQTFTVNSTATETRIASMEWDLSWSSSPLTPTQAFPQTGKELRAGNLRRRLRDIKIQRERNEAERRAQVLLGEVLGKDRLQEYLMFGSLWVELHGAKWDIGPDMVWRSAEPHVPKEWLRTDIYRSSWPGDRADVHAVGLGVVWHDCIPSADRVLGLFLELQDHDRMREFVKICCHTWEHQKGRFEARGRGRWVRRRRLRDPLAA